MKFLMSLGMICSTACASTSLPVSDHYDGKRFYNPGHQDTVGLWKSIKLIWSLEREKWPEDMTNKHRPQIAKDVKPGQAVITFVNHATMLVQLHGLNILTDPVWSRRASPFQWVGPERRREPGVNFDELPKIDLVLVSHNHYDHMDLATLKKLSKRDQPQVMVAYGDKKLLESQGIKNVSEFDWWENKSLSPQTKVTFTPTQHFSARKLFDRNKSLWGSYMVEHEGFKLYFGGDAGYSKFYTEIFQRVGSPDIALLPIGAYEPYRFMKAVHMNPAEAVQAHLDLKAKRSVAIHFGTFALTQESPERAVKDLHQAMKEKSVKDENFVVMGEGETRVF